MTSPAPLESGPPTYARAHEATMAPVDDEKRFMVLYITEELIRRASKQISGTKIISLNLTPQHADERIRVRCVCGYIHTFPLMLVH
jgi:hypothetical protein